MTNAAYGFTSMLFKALNDTTPAYAIAAFDPPGPTFRHEKFAEYKAQRLRAPDELRAQFPWAREVVEALGIPMVEIPTFEADDVIGTLAQKAEAAGLDRNDVVIAVDGRGVDNDGYDRAVGEHKPQDTVRFTVIRLGELKEIPVTIGSNPHPTYTLKPIENPTEQQKTIYKSWLGIQ